MPNVMGPLERLAFAANVAPVPVLDYVGALGLRTVFTAIRLGVFEALTEGPLTAPELAARRELTDSGAEALLDALEAVGYVKNKDGRYSLTSMAAKWVPRFASGVDFFQWMAGEGWDGLPDRLRGVAGEDDAELTFVAGDSEEENFAGMAANARLAADEVARRVKLGRTPRRLLDIGGGHGVYAARFCRRHPGLRAVVVDTPEVLDRAGPILAEEGVADRVERRPGDLWSADLGTGYDAVLLFNMLNGYPDERRRRLLARAAAALAPGGHLVVLDQMRHAASGGTARAVIELTNLRLYDPGHGGTYALPDLLTWLTEAGLTHRRPTTLFSVPWLGLVVATREAGRAPVDLGRESPEEISR